MLDSLMANIHWYSLLIGLFVGWSWKQPKWVGNLSSWVWSKVTFWKK